jgi:ABC-type dipeptide/oligopeptide/nickel transport system permease component
VVTVEGAEAVSLLNGAVAAETVLGWTGTGSLFISAIEHRDLPLSKRTWSGRRPGDRRQPTGDLSYA